MIASNHYGHHISMQRPYIDFSDKSRSSFQVGSAERPDPHRENSMGLVESSENAPCASIEHVLQSLVELVHCGMRWGGLLRESGEWHESMEEKWKDGWRRMHCWVGGRMGKVESTESITQLSAGLSSAKLISVEMWMDWSQGGWEEGGAALAGVGRVRKDAMS